MRKKSRIWLVAATSFVLVGLSMFSAAMTAYHWDFTKLTTKKYETNTYQISGEFHSIRMNTDTANIVFVPSGDGECKVVCYEAENARHSVSVQDGTLTIHAVNTRQWYESIGINIGTPKITVYLPERSYASLFIQESTGDIEILQDFMFESIEIATSTGDVKNGASALQTIRVKTSTGNICMENAAAEALDLSVSTGHVTVSSVTCKGDIKIKVSTGKAYLTSIRCKNLISDGNTGDITLKNVIATENFSIERTTGDVKFDRCDAAEIIIKTDTGDVTGNLLTAKVFMTQTDTGKVDVPQTITGGRCRLNTDTGDIKITVG